MGEFEDEFDALGAQAAADQAMQREAEQLFASTALELSELLPHYGGIDMLEPESWQENVEMLARLLVGTDEFETIALATEEAMLRILKAQVDQNLAIAQCAWFKAAHTNTPDDEKLALARKVLTNLWLRECENATIRASYECMLGIPAPDVVEILDESSIEEHVARAEKTSQAQAYIAEAVKYVLSVNMITFDKLKEPDVVYFRLNITLYQLVSGMLSEAQAEGRLSETLFEAGLPVDLAQKLIRHVLDEK